MSSINFENLITERPALAEAFAAIFVWLKDHPNVRFVEIRRVAKAFPQVSPFELVEAFDLMVQKNMAKMVFQIEDPNGDLTGEWFKNVRDIPDKPRNRMNHRFSREEGKVVSGFELQKR